MKPYYECHITMQGDPETIRPLVEEIGWKFSCIDGDPCLGDGMKCYATMHYSGRKAQMEVMDLLKDASMTLCMQAKFKVLRGKIELVIFDTNAGSCGDV